MNGPRSGLLPPVIAGVLIALGLTVHAEAVPIAGANYPEGPLWVGPDLYFAEMGADRITLWRGSSGETRTFWRREGCGPTAIAPYRDGDFLVLCHREGTAVQVDPDGRTRRVFRRDTDGRPLSNPNDASADGGGGVYFSDPGPFSLNAEARGRVMWITPGGEIRPLVTGLRYANGVYFDARGSRLYVSEHLAHRVLVYGVRAPGMLGEATVFVDLETVSPPGVSKYPLYGPDGLEVDPEGNLWVAEYGHGRAWLFSPAGEPVRCLEASTPYLTNVAVSADGRAALTGAFDNRRPPYRGQVMLLPLVAAKPRHGCGHVDAGS